jgi:chemotaxis protein MotB
MQQTKPIIVIKKKGGHGGHHGGAWKVAYADFVTAMMSLFIVLWLMNTSPKIRKAVAGYFNDPKGSSTLMGTDQSGASENLALTENNIAGLKQKIEEAIHRMNDLKALQNQIQITITPEGLRIELLETKDGTFFDTGSARLNQHGQELLEMLAGQLGQVPNRISIEGHTDAQQYASPDGYGNWELSTDRANAARRVMETTGLRKGQVSQVRGYADQKLRVPDNPMDPSNRRISLIVQYLTADAPPVPAGAEQAGSAGAGPAANPGASPPSAEKPGAGGEKPSPGAGKPSAAIPLQSRAAPAAGPGAPSAGTNPPAAAPKAGTAPAAAQKTPAAAKPAAAQTQSLVARLLAKLHKY